jgi:hypothetical protein
VPTVDGALNDLVDVYQWEKFGTMTPIEAVDACMSMILAYYDSEVTMPGTNIGSLPILANAGTGSAIAITIASGQFQNGYYEWVTPAINNFLEWVIDVPKDGDLFLFILYSKRNQNGIMTFNWDGATVGTVDGYSSAATANNIATVAVSSVTKGRHTLRMQTSSKNAASSNYGIRLTSIDYRLDEI